MMEVDGLDGDLRKFIGIAQPQASCRPAGDPVFGWLVGGMVGWLVGSGKDCRQLQEQVRTEGYKRKWAMGPHASEATRCYLIW